MNKDLRVEKQIDINSSEEALWSVLTEPEKIKIYLYGTNTITNWEEGQAILFEGEYEGQTYKDKGVVLEFIPNKSLKYTYWSGFSGLEDHPENYSLIQYKIDKKENGQLTFSWIQEGFSNEQGAEHTANGLAPMLERIKELAENA